MRWKTQLFVLLVCDHGWDSVGITALAEFKVEADETSDLGSSIIGANIVYSLFIVLFIIITIRFQYYLYSVKVLGSSVAEKQKCFEWEGSIHARWFSTIVQLAREITATVGFFYTVRLTQGQAGFAGSVSSGWTQAAVRSSRGVVCWI